MIYKQATPYGGYEPTLRAAEKGQWGEGKELLGFELVNADPGRPLVSGLPFQTVNLLIQGHTFPDRLNSLDIRAGKILKFGGTRTNIAIDFYNLFNSNTGTAYNQTYDPVTNGATWLSPSTVLNPRFARFNVTVDF